MDGKEKNKIMKGKMYEIPVSSVISHKVFNPEYMNAWSYEDRRRVWALRPNGNNLSQMYYVINSRKNSGCEYLEFMLHSSELMPGGSPRLQSAEDVERIYTDIKSIFERISRHYLGIGLEAYSQILKNREYQQIESEDFI